MRALLLVLLCSAAIGTIPLALGILPPPAIHDEFAYLLQADTFVHRRLANPSPPHREFFETMHVLTTPTYAAKFPPAQGAALAVGELLGEPRLGVIAVIALACAAVTWMLRAWMPWRWAALGGLLAATHPLILSWQQSHWGGGVAMLGGALTGGAALRLARRPTWPAGWTFAAGGAILANSRPFEGALLVFILLVWLVRAAERRELWLPLTMRAAIPSILVGITTIAWIMFYDVRVTGHPLRPPWSEYARQYMVSPAFWWQTPTPAPLYGNGAMAQFHGENEWQEYARQHGLTGFIRGVGEKLREMAADWFWPPTLVLPGLWALRRGRRAGLPIAICLLVPMLHFALTPLFREHYLGVVAGFFFLWTAMGMRALIRGGRAGVFLTCAVIAAQAAAAAWQLSGLLYRPSVAGLPRQMCIEEISRLPGKHVIFVQYTPGRRSIVEWVYNSAEIDAQRVVIARDLGPRNAELRAYYPDRTAWLAVVGDYSYEVRRMD